MKTNVISILLSIMAMAYFCPAHAGKLSFGSGTGQLSAKITFTINGKEYSQSQLTAKINNSKWPKKCLEIKNTYLSLLNRLSNDENGIRNDAIYHDWVFYGDALKNCVKGKRKKKKGFASKFVDGCTKIVKSSGAAGEVTYSY